MDKGGQSPEGEVIFGVFPKALTPEHKPHLDEELAPVAAAFDDPLSLELSNEEILAMNAKLAKPLRGFAALMLDKLTHNVDAARASQSQQIAQESD